MEKVTESFWIVFLYQNFPFYMGMAVASGLIVGGIFNRGVQGLQRSLVTLFPLIFLVLAATGDHIFYLSQRQEVQANSYNSFIRLALLFTLYSVGLFFGHTIVSYQVKKLYQKHGVQPAKNKDLLIEV